MASAPPVVDCLGDRTTPALFGMFFNYALHGALTVQVYRYYCMFPRDNNSVKLIVCFVYLLELGETSILTFSGYTTFGPGYGNSPMLNRHTATWIAQWIMTPLIPTIVQLFYTHRLYSVSDSKILGAIVLVLSCIEFGTATVAAILQYFGSAAGSVGLKATVLVISLSACAACDILLAVAMGYHAGLKKGVIMSTAMRNTVSRIVLFTIHTGTITALTAVVQIFLVVALSSHGYFQTGSYVSVKLYSNSLLALLNARAVTIGGRHDLTPSQKMAELSIPDSGMNQRSDTIRRTEGHAFERSS
ncbi:hypothetical protein FB45DRAFT_932940 [Roridomyces roridus]|uniref:DUF6534 domain-containing protein n=1 Tax=Roridomyces roridus TaxID=1738132 RepID=A0AAD7BDA6_9AGAR|nr:hypothetical protein FB45DRAFT_932940 [Roridomyces roridus]